MRLFLHRVPLLLTLILSALVTTAEAQLARAWMVPAVAHTGGVGGTFWRSDVSIHNPHGHELPVVIQLLPSGTENWQVPTFDVTLYPYETINLWDALGDDLFAHQGTGAMLVYADPSLECADVGCELLVTSRTYTSVPWEGYGEFGQTVSGASLADGVDWSTLGYAAGILNDGAYFRCNVGVASWTADWTVLRVDVQDAAGTIVATEELSVPPFGHVQRRLRTATSGGSLVFYLVSGPADALVYPYASVADQETGDPSFVAATPSVVGLAKGGREVTRDGGRPLPGVAGERRELDPRLRRRPRPARQAPAAD